MGPEPTDSDAGFDFAALPSPARRPHISIWPNRRCFAAAVLVTVLLHGYALTVLPAVLDYIPWDDEFVVEINITNDDIGDPDVITNYNVDRIEEVSVPGPIDLNDEIGVEVPVLEKLLVLIPVADAGASRIPGDALFRNGDGPGFTPAQTTGIVHCALADRQPTPPPTAARSNSVRLTLGCSR